MNFFANDTKLTAISSTSCTPATVPPNPLCSSTGIESTTGTAYGAAANGGLYSSIAPGAYSFSGRIAAATDNGLSVAKLSSTLADGKHYSLYTSGFYDATAKTVDAFVVEDAFSEEIDFSKSSARFVNASSNSSPMTLYAKNPATGDSLLIGVVDRVQERRVLSFHVPPAVYDLTVRYAGSNTAVITACGSFVRRGAGLHRQRPRRRDASGNRHCGQSADPDDVVAELAERRKAATGTACTNGVRSALERAVRASLFACSRRLVRSCGP